jgi:hypothetical protein
MGEVLLKKRTPKMELARESLKRVTSICAKDG